MNLYRKHFGKKLKEALRLKNLSQAALSEHLDVEPATVSRWTNGVSLPEEWRIQSILEFLNVDESFFAPETANDLGAMALIDILNSYKDTLFLLPKVPSEIIELLAKQDSKYFESLKRTLESIEEKKMSIPKSKANIS